MPNEINNSLSFVVTGLIEVVSDELVAFVLVFAFLKYFNWSRASPKLKSISTKKRVFWMVLVKSGWRKSYSKGSLLPPI